MRQLISSNLRKRASLLGLELYSDLLMFKRKKVYLKRERISLRVRLIDLYLFSAFFGKRSGRLCAAPL